MSLYTWIKRNRAYGIAAGFIGLTLFCIITIKIFFFPIDIPNGTVAAYTAFMGTGLTLLFTMWKNARDKNANSKDDNK